MTKNSTGNASNYQLSRLGYQEISEKSNKEQHSQKRGVYALYTVHTIGSPKEIIKINMKQ
jgi:hypothetical protein